MASYRFCPRDHNKETPVEEWYNEEFCLFCEHFNPKNHIACGYYVIQIKEQQALKELQRKEKFMKDIDDLKERIKKKEELIISAREEGELGEAIRILGQKIELESLLNKKELAKIKYFG